LSRKLQQKIDFNSGMIQKATMAILFISIFFYLGAIYFIMEAINLESHVTSFYKLVQLQIINNIFIEHFLSQY